MEYNFTINDFEGPLDLLLHLIKKKEMDILDIDVSQLADQYVTFIKEQKNLKLEIASEFLVMASYLIEIKSKAIIPIEDLVFDDQYNQIEKNKLIEKLIEYKKFKKSVSFFEEKSNQRSKLHTKNPEALSHLEIPWEDRNLDNKINPDSLQVAMQKMFDRLRRQQPLETFISANPINLEELEINIIKKVNQESKFSFMELFHKRRDRAFIVATIICVLDLTKNKIIKLKQKENFGEIIIERS